MAGSIRFGGDAESFMEAPEQSHASLSDIMGGGSIIASLLDLVGIHRQVAKGPKDPAGPEAASATPPAPAQVPQVLTDVASVFTPQEVPVVPTTQNAPMTGWGQRWLDSLKPLTAVDPNDYR
jgi:hypothetical protein